MRVARHLLAGELLPFGCDGENIHSATAPIPPYSALHCGRVTRYQVHRSAITSELPTYDRKLALSKVGGNPGIADELLEMLLADLPDLSAALQSAHRELNCESLREVAHRIHGAACCCATPALKRAAMNLEQMAAAAEMHGLGEVHDNLQQEITRLLSDHAADQYVNFERTAPQP